MSTKPVTPTPSDDSESVIDNSPARKVKCDDGVTRTFVSVPGAVPQVRARKKKTP